MLLGWYLTILVAIAFLGYRDTTKQVQLFDSLSQACVIEARLNKLLNNQKPLFTFTAGAMQRIDQHLRLPAWSTTACLALLIVFAPTVLLALRTSAIVKTWPSAHKTLWT